MMALFRLVLLLFLSSCTAVLADFLFDSGAVSVYRCSENSTIATPQMSANINSLVAQLTSSTSQNRFSVATYGKGTDQVYGLGQCRRDVNIKDCARCLRNATLSIRTFCQNRADVWMWYNDTCFLRFDDNKFFGTVDPSSFDNLYASDHPQHPSAFKKQLDALISKVSSEAIVPANEGVGKERSFSVASNATIYALAQCTRDLSQHSCNDCLNTVTGNFLKFCNNDKSVGCRVASTGCYVHYEIYPFYFPLD
ncbi:cysteine-rich repeat secretory protein 55-like [Coffea eugenioides]|uniref:Cysteine-rich repeat secretory protein 55-like n=1 Tax=Coffea arabica TaxID=13443 RepID=A0A6P6SZ41_COFAR|nr:cysteine-rich repeat secretory protein 55-like [Coffea arabica]XP_027174943.1 cysteine-rich repeat secretory protein 55-like [Coffea eugenioides]